ncbi:MAG: hypothetical protein HYY59_07670 [Candidatus Omnitrophica bacterium]|nr:hypothetical protein [Candidatus Omnitrophota bacterium]
MREPGSLSHRRKLAVRLLAIVGFVWSLEVCEGIWVRRQTYAAAARRLGVAYDTRLPFEVVRELRQRGLDAIPVFNRPWSTNIHHPEDGVFALGGWANKLTVLCNENGYYAMYESDLYGFNNPPDAWRGGRPDVVLLGDSFVQGSCVWPDQTIAARLREASLQTLNLGYGGNGPLGMLATLMEYAALLRPHIVLWCYYEGNDIADLNTEKQYPYLRNMAFLKSEGRQDLRLWRAEVDQLYSLRATGGVLSARQEFVKVHGPEAISWIDWIMYRRLHGWLKEDSLGLFAIQCLKLSHLRTRVATVLRLFDATRQSQEVLDEELFRHVLAATKEVISSWDGQMYVVYLPEWRRYRLMGRPNRYRDHMLQLLRSLEIPVIDIDEAFRAHGDPLNLFPFRLQGHYNEQGYRVVAQAILERIAVRH